MHTYVQLRHGTLGRAVKYYLHQNSQTVKKGAAHAKKKQHEKSCEIKGGGPEVAVVV